MTETNEYHRRYAEMVRRNEKIIFSVCYFYASPDVGFEDLRQEVLISLFTGYGNFKGISAETTWVYKVCINTCLFALRKFAHKLDVVPLDSMSGIELNDSYDDEFRQKLEWLHAAISCLNPMDKAIILMWLDELSYDEIAANMGIPRNTVASRLHRIKSKLASKI